MSGYQHPFTDVYVRWRIKITDVELRCIVLICVKVAVSLWFVVATLDIQRESEEEIWTQTSLHDKTGVPYRWSQPSLHRSPLDYLPFVTIIGVSISVSYLSGIKPETRDPLIVTGVWLEWWVVSCMLTIILPGDSWVSSPTTTN